MTDKKQDRKLAGQVDDIPLLLVAMEELMSSTLIPKLTDFEKYHAHVARNSLGILARQAEARDVFEDLDARNLEALGLDASLGYQQLATKIKSGEIEMTGALLNYLKQRTLLQLSIDNPKYWGYAQAREQWSDLDYGEIT